MDMSGPIGEIGVPTGVLAVEMVSEAEFHALLGRIAEPDRGDAAAFEAYIDEKRETEDWLRCRVAVEWAPEHDFEVARDENIAFIMCGSIYTPAVFCRDYLAILHRILTTMRAAEKWAYATSVEPVSPRRRVSDQFVLLNGVVYVLSARISFDFLRRFSRTKADAEKEGIWWLDDP